MMAKETMTDIVEFAKRLSFQVADITGGAPEMVPGIGNFIQQLRPFFEKLIMRSNLVLLLKDEYLPLLELCKSNNVSLVASFPSTNERQADTQRGQGVWQESIEGLKRLNSIGYGVEGSGLELNLVANPTGAFLPVDQCKAEKKIKVDLARKWGIKFNNLYTFANVPLGRFHQWLEKSGNLEPYMEKLFSNFNPATIENLMCRTLVSVSWDGYLYDCDFNLANDLPMSGKKIHVSQVESLPIGSEIVVDNHCYACTAGAGFT